MYKKPTLKVECKKNGCLVKKKKKTASEQFVCQQLADPTACKWAYS